MVCFRPAYQQFMGDVEPCYLEFFGDLKLDIVLGVGCVSWCKVDSWLR
jgi:hypothetical protein